MKKRKLLSMAVGVSLAVFMSLTGCQKGVTDETTQNQELQVSEETTQALELNGVQEESKATILYQGHGSMRVVTKEGKVIYIDPFAGEGYDKSADLILITHKHSDHNAIELIENKNSDCQTITYKEALVDGEHKSFDLGYVNIEAVEAGNNENHDIKECVGYILTLSDGKSIYVSGDTSTTEQMSTFTERNLDYAFFCCDGIYNMNVEEAAECAKTVKAKHSIPYHMVPNAKELYNKDMAEAFNVEGKLLVPDGTEIVVE